jgi:hypothetical protein
MSTRGPRKCPCVEVGKVYVSGHFKIRTQMYIICDVHAWTFLRSTRGRRFPAGHSPGSTANSHQTPFVPENRGYEPRCKHSHLVVWWIRTSNLNLNNAALQAETQTQWSPSQTWNSNLQLNLLFLNHETRPRPQNMRQCPDFEPQSQTSASKFMSSLWIIQ